MQILTINGGSSSIKFALFAQSGATHERLLTGKIDHIGLASASIYSNRKGVERTNTLAIPAIDTAVTVLTDFLEGEGVLKAIDVVAHRVVHGGHFQNHAVLSSAVLRELERMVPYDPDHMPGELALIQALGSKLGDATHIACFDTVFHAGMPAVASMLAIPRSYSEKGLRRYGFHGLSYTHLRDTLCEEAGEHAANGRVILAHLGSGASLVALSGGETIDTSMAFSPNSGIMMGTRSGDIDPGVIAYLAREEKKTPEEIDKILSKESGLYGVSGSTYDMYELLGREHEDPYAKIAVDMFCYAVKKQIGAYVAALGGIDTIVFTGGMGEQSAPVRARILHNLDFLGITVDESRNTHNEAVISPLGAPVTIRVIPADEERVMADIARKLIATHT